MSLKSLIKEVLVSSVGQLAFQANEFVRDNAYQYSKYKGGYNKRDWLGQLLPDAGGGDAPTLVAWRGNVRQYGYTAANQKGDGFIHVPHDWVRGQDLYWHPHAEHNGASASGNLTFNLDIYHQVDNRRAGAAQGISLSKTGNTISFTGVSAYKTPITDILIATAGGGAGLFDSNLIYPDDAFCFTVTVTGIPTITTGTNAIAIPSCDIHAPTKDAMAGTKNYTPGSFEFWD